MSDALERSESFSNDATLFAAVTPEDNKSFQQLLSQIVPVGALPTIVLETGNTPPSPLKEESGKGGGSADFDKYGVKVPPGKTIEDVIKSLDTRIISRDGTIRPGDGGKGGAGKAEDLHSTVKEAVENAFKTFVTDQPLEKVSESAKRDLDRKAEQIAGLIGNKGDFYAGHKRETVQQALDEATKLGPAHVKYLLDKVNSQLQKTNPDLKLQGSFTSAPHWYQKDTGLLDIQLPPVKGVESKSAITLVNAKTGTVEDRMQSQYRSMDTRK